jgi:hypothetical protein
VTILLGNAPPDFIAIKSQNAMNSTTSSVTRDELYELVWKEPMTKVAPRFGLANVGLAKACKRYDIPRPPVGYWAKKEYGKAPEPTPLPPIKDGMSNELRFLPEERPKPIRPPIKSPSDRVTDETLKGLIAREELPENRISIGEQPSRYHPLVSSTKSAFKGGQEYRGLCQPNWQYEGEKLHICVSRDLIPRALMIMDVLLRSLEKRGHKVVREKQEYGGVGVFVEILNEKFSLSLREKLKMIRIPESERRRSYESVRYEPKGLLELQATLKDWKYTDLRWTDTATKKIDDRLNEVMIDLLVGVEGERNRRRRAKEAEEQRRIEEMKRWEREKERRREEEKVTELNRMVEKWNQAARIRAFVADIYESNRQRNAVIAEGSELEQWLNWALKHADTIDPLGAARFSKEEIVESEEWVHPGLPR